MVRLERDFGAGTIVRRITDSGFDVPTTIDRSGPFLYAVNARLGAEPTPDTPYWLTRVGR